MQGRKAGRREARSYQQSQNMDVESLSQLTLIFNWWVRCSSLRSLELELRKHRRPSARPAASAAEAPGPRSTAQLRVWRSQIVVCSLPALSGPHQGTGGVLIGLCILVCIYVGTLWPWLTFWCICDQEDPRARLSTPTSVTIGRCGLCRPWHWGLRWWRVPWFRSNPIKGRQGQRPLSSALRDKGVGGHKHSVLLWPSVVFRDGISGHYKVPPVPSDACPSIYVVCCGTPGRSLGYCSQGVYLPILLLSTYFVLESKGSLI